MSYINYSTREINCKIAYVGPAFSGKTTNLQYIYNKTPPEKRGKMLSVAGGTETDPTLSFDFLPAGVSELRGFKVRFQLCTLPGQVQFDASRKLLLKDIDGVVFVADSQAGKMEANTASQEILAGILGELAYDMAKLPFVIQYNKRDMSSDVTLDDLRGQLNLQLKSDFEATATKGVGVFETFNMVCKLVLTELKKGG
ncbi:MAG TPA: GTPase domain-containing protein [Pseudomonadota bacterium]|nr:GTPase domain-containing protein [Pseudomonadota bacterium]